MPPKIDLPHLSRKLLSPYNPVLDITALVALSTLIVMATLATIMQIDKDVIAAESIMRQLKSQTSECDMLSIPVAERMR